MIGFEWDDARNAQNIKKHGVRFETATLVSSDENHVELYDVEHSQDEDRYIAIGMVDRVLVVVFVERMSAIRIISVRPANKREEMIDYDCRIHT